MSLRAHRTPEVKVRKQVPSHLRRREGAHFVRTRYEPEVCGYCFGKGHVYDVRNAGDSPVVCPVCEGAGEV